MNNREPIRVACCALFIVSWCLTLACLSQTTTGVAGRPAPPSLTQIEEAIRHDPRNPKLFVELGLAYWEKDDYPRALEAFQQAVKVDPSSAEAHNWLGVAIMEKADLPSAISEFRKAVSLDPKYARAYINLGSALAKSGELDAAIHAFNKSLALDPNSLAAHINLGMALREKGDTQAALLHLRRAVSQEPTNANLQYDLAQTLRQAGKLDDAIAAFEKALKLNPELRDAYYGLGQALKQLSAARTQPGPTQASAARDAYNRAQEAVLKGDLSGAKAQLIEAIRADDSYAEAHNLLGYVLGQQGDLEFARNHLERAIQLRPEYADAHYNLGIALWYSGLRERGVSELRQSVRLDPASGASYAFLGMALRQMGDLEGARLSLERAIALIPPATATYIDLAIVFLRLGDLDRALGQLEAGLNLPSSGPTADWDTVIADLRTLLAKNPGRADAHNMLGLLLGRKGADTSEVLAELREAVRLRPDYPQAHNNIGLVLAQSDDDDNAILEFREAIRLRPDYADAHANLGATLMSSDNAQAIRELEKAVSLDPHLIKARFNLAEAYGQSSVHGRDEQIDELRKLISISPSFARAHLALGKALLDQHKVDEAVAELREASRDEPDSGEAHYQLGLALARSGKQQEGRAEVQKGRELSAADERNQNANLDIAEARTALAQGELEQAQAKLLHAIKLQPDSSVAQHYLGVVREKQGDTMAAEAAYQKALDLNSGDLASRRALDRLRLPETPTPFPPPTSSSDSTEQVAELEGYIRQNRFQEVEPLLIGYVKQYPNSSWGWYALGYSQFAQKKLGESIQSLAKSLQLNISNAEAHKILGRDLMMIGRFDRAEIEFEQGIRYDPKSAEMHYNLGKLLSIEDNWQRARQEFEQAIRIDPSYIEALDALGLAEEALGDDAGAVASYQKAIALNEERKERFAGPAVNLSAYFNRTGDSRKALSYAEKALELDDKSDKAWFQRARALEHEGQLEAAADALKRAISLNSRSSSYYYVLAGIYRRLGRTSESQKALESFTRLDRENSQLEKMRRTMANPKALPPGGERE